MHAAANSPRGGVSPRSTRLRGQGLIEYVLLIAVISLTVAFAGPPVAGAIGNQFTAIADAVGGSITGGAIGGIGGGIGGGTSGGNHSGGTTGGGHGTSGGTSGGGTTVNPGGGNSGNSGSTGGGSSSGTVNPGSGSTGSQTTKPGQPGTNPGGGNTGSTGNTGSNGSGTGSTTVNPGSGSTGNTGTTGGGSSSGTVNPGSGSTGSQTTKPGQSGTNPGGGLEKKDPKDWTLIDQKVVAEDISKNGTGSKYYLAALKAMDEGTKWKTVLMNGQTLEYRIIGINHDDLADGSGKAGLTFEATNNVLGAQRMNATNSSAGGWEKSELRGRLNSGDLWALLPAEIQSMVKAVTKMTDNKGGGGTAGTPTATTDKVFLLSTTEVYGDLDSDGTQYEYYKSKGVSTSSYSGASSSSYHWTRSVHPIYS